MRTVKPRQNRDSVGVAGPLESVSWRHKLLGGVYLLAIISEDAIARQKPDPFGYQNLARLQ